MIHLLMGPVQWISFFVQRNSRTYNFYIRKRTIYNETNRKSATEKIRYSENQNLCKRSGGCRAYHFDIEHDAHHERANKRSSGGQKAADIGGGGMEHTPYPFHFLKGL